MPKAPTDIRSLARSHSESAVKTLVGIMNQSEAPPAARVAAANSLLDRGWGKAPQEMTVKRVSVKELGDDELAAIAAGSSEGDTSPPLDPTQLN